MANGYWIGRIDVANPEGYKEYVGPASVAVGKFGGRFLARGGKYECVEGNARARNVILEFPSYEAALACWHSPEYRAAAAIRERNSQGDFIVMEGYDGPQPENSR
mgnify:CR=1 FL=1